MGRRRCPPHPSGSGLLGRRRHHQAGPGRLLPRGMGLDGATRGRASAVAGALSGRHQGSMLLPEARIGGPDRAQSAHRDGFEQAADHRGREPRRIAVAGPGRRARGSCPRLDDRSARSLRPDRLRPRSGRGHRLARRARRRAGRAQAAGGDRSREFRQAFGRQGPACRPAGRTRRLGLGQDFRAGLRAGDGGGRPGPLRRHHGQGGAQGEDLRGLPAQLTRADLGRRLFDARTRRGAGVRPGVLARGRPDHRRQPIYGPQSDETPARPQAGPVEGHRPRPAEAARPAEPARARLRPAAAWDGNQQLPDGVGGKTMSISNPVGLRARGRGSGGSYACGAAVLLFGVFGAGCALAAEGGAGPSEALFLTQIVVLMLSGRLLGEAMLRIGQPAVMGQLLAGVILGPSLLGLIWPDLQHALSPATPAQKSMLDAVSQFGILLLLLLTGMETDLKLVRKVGAAAISVSLTGVAVPFACGVALGEFLPESLLPRPDQRLLTSLFLGTALSISSIKIVAAIVRDMKFTRRNLGQVIVASAILEDSIGWIIIAITFGLAQAGTIDILNVAKSVIGAAAFMAVSLTVGRRVVFWLIRWANDSFASEFAVITMILGIMGLMALTTHAIGVHTVLGAFVSAS